MVTGNTQSESSHRELCHLAGLYSVQTRYCDALGKVREPSVQSLMDALRALGAEVGGPADLGQAIRSREARLWERVVEPVLVAWEGKLPGLTLRLAGRPGAASLGRASGSVRLTLTLEDGSSISGEVALGATTAAVEATVDGRVHTAFSLSATQTQRALNWPGGRLPWGYHRVRVEAGDTTAETLVISAPVRCWTPQGGAAAQRGAGGHGAREAAAQRGAGSAGMSAAHPLAGLAGRRWGLFAPVYALRSARDHGAGDLADLKALLAWTGRHGGDVVATLPLLASESGPEADPSPYRPLSRLFWNEFFLAVESLPEWQLCPEARALWGSASSRAEDARLRAGDLVDYQGVLDRKRPVLEALAGWFFQHADAERRADYQAYLGRNPLAPDYASFRAGTEPAADGRERRRRYHLYCQWQMDQQLSGLTQPGGPGLLFDLPLGVHPHGFDVECFPGRFAAGVSTGAPPDTFFAKGQDWQTPPLDVWADRTDGYGYFRACLRTLMRPAAALRVDHMMSFHRLFWIPEGSDPKDGVYVGHPADELYALLSCESHLHHTEVVGEDLGTVPEGVRRSMRRHSVARTSIFLGSLRPRAAQPFAPVPSDALVTLETHDMVPLMGFLQGDDIQTRLSTGQLDAAGARREAAARRRLVSRLAETFGAPAGAVDAAAPLILAGALDYLGRSAARLVLVNVEDLLLERRPQNVPGTGMELPNWRRKMAVPLEELPGYADARK